MKYARILATFLVPFYSVSAEAYELGTHGQLTYHASLRSVLAKDQSLLKSLGLFGLSADEPFGNAYYDIAGSQVRTRFANPFESSEGRMPDGARPLSIEGWLLRGAIREDDLGFLFGNPYGADPHDDPDGPIWRVMHHFYDPARDRPLTIFATTKEQRDRYWATTFRALGDIVHHLQDMAQPQHTRNDAHAGVGIADETQLRGTA